MSRRGRTVGPSIRELLQEPGPLLAMGAHDGLLGRIAERAGFPALFHGSYAVAAAHGVPDIGLVGLADTAAGVRQVASSVRIPVIADMDTGYGEEASVWRTVRQLELAGASAVQMEDQVFPKRCGHMAGKDVISRAAMISKIRTACAARDPETVVVARTDALQVHGIEEAVARCDDYAEAGADVVFVDAPGSIEELTAAARVDAPAMFNTTETGRTPLLTVPELEAIGFKVIIYPSNQMWTIAGAYEQLCRAVLDTGSTAAVRDTMMPFDEVNDLLGLATYQAMEV